MDHNVIQSPEVLQRLAKFLGMRGAHITPTLNEGVQAVVVVGDVSMIGDTFRNKNLVRSINFSQWCPTTASLLNDSVLQVRNISTTTVWRLKRMMIRTLEGNAILVRIARRDAAIPTVLANGSIAYTNWVNEPGPGGTAPPAAQQSGSVLSGNFLGQLGANAFHSMPLTASAPIEIHGGIILGPGQGLVVQSLGSANVTLFGQFDWIADEYS